MKLNHIATTLALVLLPLLMTGQTTLVAQGTVIEGLSFKGDILDHEVEYAVYLPPGYEALQRSYPILYLLHGYSDDETGWIQFGDVERIVNNGIASGLITPMIIVMPDGGVTFYVNNHSGSERWGDMFIEEFIPHVEDGYKVRGTKRYRAIAGLSMGGYGALVHSLKHPDTFSGCGAFSAAVWTDEQMKERYENARGSFMTDLYGPMTNGELPEQWSQHSPIDLVNTQPVDELRSVRYWIDCGDDDFLTIGNAALHIALIQREIPHEYRVRDGAHNWTYWRTGLTDALSFLSDGFRQK